MCIYLKNNTLTQFVEFEEKLDSNLYDNIGETYEDYLLGKWVLLTDEMVSFYKNNIKVNCIPCHLMPFQGIQSKGTI